MTETFQPKRIAIITGAAGGIGLACARRLSRDCTIVATDLDLDRLEHATRDIPDVQCLGGDISDPATVQALKDLTAGLGQVGVLVNAAGISPKIGTRSARLEEITLQEWNRVMAVNVTSILLTCQTFMPQMTRAGWGRIVNISSLAGRTKSVVAGPTYSASKAAVLGLTRTIAAEVARQGVTVNAIAPGRIDTPMARLADEETNRRYAEQIPVGRMGTADEVASAVAYLASEDAAFITGVALDVNGGFFMV